MGNDSFQSLLYEAERRKALIKQMQENMQRNMQMIRPSKLPENQGFWGAMQGKVNSLMSGVNGL